MASISSLLKLAIEGLAVESESAPASLDTGGTHTGGSGPEAVEGGEKDLIILKGPLAEQFSQALAKLYSKTPEVKTEEAQAEAMEGVAIESQANDALTLQEFADTTQVLGEDEATDNATTVYGVDAADVKPEDVVEVSQDLADWNAEDEDFVVVMNADEPSVNGEGGNAEPQVSEYAKALEAMCLRAGVPVYPSLESFAEKRKQDKEKVKALKFKSGNGKLTEGHEASDIGQGLEFCDPEVLGVVTKLAQEKIDVNLGEDSEFFPAGSKIDPMHEEKVKDFVKEVELHFKGKIDPKAGVSIKTPKQVAKYFSKGAINGKAIKAVV
jgi:hypothetical protein